MKETLDRMSIPAVQDYLAMLQGIITRMSTNSSNCKTWTVTIVAAILVLLVDKDIKIPNAWICFIPVVLFYFLDCFYLGMERRFVKLHRDFLNSVINDNEEFVKKIYKIEKSSFCEQFMGTLHAMISFSTTPFYLIVAMFILSLQ